MREVYLGIDLGTSSVKVVLLDNNARQLAVAQESYPVNRAEPLWAEQDPILWWTATSAAIAAVLASGTYTVVSVGLAGQMHGLVLLDADGVPLRPAITWSDSRADAQVAIWHDAIDPQRVEQITGFPVALGMLGVSLTWVRDHEPALYAQARTALSPKDYVRYRLTGRLNLEPTDAGGSILYDIRAGVLSTEILDAVGLRADLFPAVIPTLSIAGEVTQDAARATGLTAGTPVAAGGSDQSMAALALGLDDPTRAAVAISSGGTVFTRTDGPLDHSLGLHVMPDAVAGQWLAMGVLLSTGLGVSWLVERMMGASPTPERITALMKSAERVAPGSEGLLFSPNLNGIRTPVVDSTMRGSIVGLGIDHGIEHVARAMVEGVCIALSSSLASMNDAQQPVRELVISGGLARFTVWRQTLSDVTGLPVSVSSDLEHSAIGAAYGASIAVGRTMNFDASNRISETLQPDAAHHDLYTQLARDLVSVEHALAHRKDTTS
ncbi:MAG: xylulokinase [Microbacteriaceae bacterium]